jgi:hypothetical protein
MNKEFLRAVLLALVPFLAVDGFAAEETPDSPLPSVPAPTAPFIVRAPEQSSWVIAITPTGKSPRTSSAKSLRAQLWTKSGTAVQCANQWSDGTQTEDTILGPSKIAQSLDGKGVHLYNPKLNPRYHDFSAGDFEMLDWLTPQNYVNAVNHAGQPCYLFYTKGAAPTAGASEAHDLTLAEVNIPPSPTSVYVSVRTRLPVEIDNATDRYVFQFGSPGELKMPDLQPPAPPPTSPPAPSKKKTTSSKTKAVKKSDSINQTNAPSAARNL